MATNQGISGPGDVDAHLERRITWQIKHISSVALRASPAPSFTGPRRSKKARRASSAEERTRVTFPLAV
jgi:hypothetical protein